MSARFKVTHGSEVFEVEITSDGELTIPGYDKEQLEYEIAFAAMGGDKSHVLLWLDKWQQDPTGIIIQNLGLDDGTLRLLAADWAEHVLPIFERAYPKDKRPRKAIKAARDFVAGKITAAQLAKAREAAWAAKRAAEKVVAAAGAAGDAAARAATAAWMAAQGEWARSPAERKAAAAWAAAAAARSAWKAAAASARDAASDSVLEQAWQVRHFVHVMECFQVGKVWPPIKDTP